MRIGIVACANTNPYATSLAARLIQRNLGLHCILLAQESPVRRLLAYMRFAGLKGTASKVAERYRPGGLPDNDARFHLREDAARHHLADWDTPLSILAAKHGISVVRMRSLHDEAAVQCIRDNNLDLLLNTAGVIFKPALLEAPRLGMLNAHMARLPRFRGMNVLEWSLWFGERPGVTVHFVTPGIDQGEILEFREIPLLPADTVASLRARSYPTMVNTMLDCITALSEGRETRTPQHPEEGRQYFVMHPRLLAIVEQKLNRMKTASA